MLASNTVLDEQEEQSLSGIFDDAPIAEIYLQTTCSCQLWASVVGIRDQRAAEEDMD
jgi:hypothetical protein